MDGSPAEIEVEVKYYPLLVEMLRSFTTLAATLNLSHAVRELGSTRQTVRRHIAQLESAIGVPLFEVNDRSYELTPEADQVLEAARGILARGHLLLNGGLKDIDGLSLLTVRNQAGWEFHQQQMPLSHVWNGRSELLKAAMKAWTESEGRLDSPHMDLVRPYMLVYRDSALEWICVEIGEESFYSKWWGWRAARSNVGRPLNQFPGGPEIASMMDVPYREVSRTQGARIDQVATRIPREPDGEPVPNVFDRLLLGARFPDDSVALIVVVDRPSEVEIAGVDQVLLEEMPKDVEIAFNAC